MPLLGQASGGWTESSSALRLLHAGVRNSTGVLTADAFTQTNPPIVTVAATISTKVNTATRGVLSGSVAFTRPDEGSNFIGGNIETGLTALQEFLVKPLGVFMNTAVGNAYENTPGPASGKNTYMSSQGTYGNQLYETQALAAVGAYAQGDDLLYVAGMELIASRNGYLMPAIDSAGASFDAATTAAESEHAGAPNSSTTLGLLKMPADATQNEVVFDQRV